uniref:Growth factor receptor-bound protein 10a n=1 Tax=Neogobius melanostomus TaxID=47308 RepID=A0A8C6WGP8_9GOBI
LVNEMNSSMESVYSTQLDTALLLNNGHHVHPTYQAHGPPRRRHTPPVSSQPMHIQAVRRIQEEQHLRPASLPAIPNPFPELCSPASSPGLSAVFPHTLPHQPSVSVCVCQGCLLPSSGRFFCRRTTVTFSETQPGCPPSTINYSLKLIVKVWSEDGAGKVVEIPADMTARDLCQLLVYKSHCVDDNAWTIVEHHPILGLERCLEDHELVVQVQSSLSGDSKFLFRKNYAKYEFFKNPLNFFPEQMVAWCQESDDIFFLQNFLNSSSCPEIQGYLYVKESGRKSWKKLYMFLRRSGLYYSTKGTSKEPRHLQLLSDLDESNIFTTITSRKPHNAPQTTNSASSDCKELKMLCAEDEQSRTCWMTAFRLFKYGIILYQNYSLPQQRKATPSHFSAPVRSVSENSLVAMDFSGRTGRVIENPVEAQSAALEEGQSWRKRGQRMNVLGSSSPLHPSSLSTVIHRTQVWFHGRIMREEAHKMIMQQGQVDGLFLLRDSQSNPKAFVLTLCHHQKIKHFQILPCEEDGQVFFSLDDGATKFTDLIHLVEFYQLNRGVLPCKLKHPCTAVAL